MRHDVPHDLVAAADDERGLTSAEAAARLIRHGPNDVIESAAAGWSEVARDTSRDPMIWFLVGTAGLFMALGEHVEAAVLACAILPIVGMDAWLHRRTRASTAGLASRLASRTRVIRDGTTIEASAADVVPGDLVVVSTAEYLPADGVVVGGTGLQVDESALSGESLPQRKIPVSGDAATIAAGVEDVSWGSAGTRLLTGELRLRVARTGARTLYGEIARMAQAGARDPTPLQRAIAALVNALIAAAGVLCLALAATRYQQGHGVVDSLLSAVTLAVAALPEEFPVVFAVYLGVGVFRLARRKALVRRAVVVENIGRLTTICSDKTGTLTEGTLRLEHLVPAFGLGDEALLAIAARASRADSHDPVDVAILERGTVPDGPRLATFPFNEKSRREVAIFTDAGGGQIAVAKGAPETILGMSVCDDGARHDWLQRAAALAADGHKVIACAQRTLHEWPGGEPDRGFEFAGLLAFEDPVRPGVVEAIAQAKRAGLRVMMLTGDHPSTARAIARVIGLGTESPQIVEGTELDARLEQLGAAALDAVDVVARCLPGQKLDIVRNLQARGEIVAVTGDGVNDAPALQGADVGIAMGERGTRPARDVAAIVLLDDNFRTIVRAIMEGRQLFRNLKHSFAYLLIVHVPLVLTAAFVPLAGFPLLYLPIHIVWLELIIHPTALLVFQQWPDEATTGAPGGAVIRHFFTSREWFVIGCCGTFLTILVAGGYAYSLGPRDDVMHARSVAMGILMMGSASTTLSLSGCRVRAAWIVSVAAVGSLALVTSIERLAALVHLQPLHVDDWLGAIVAGATVGMVALGFGCAHPLASATSRGPELQATR